MPIIDEQILVHGAKQQLRHLLSNLQSREKVGCIGWELCENRHLLLRRCAFDLID